MSKGIFISENCQFTHDGSKIRSAVNPTTEVQNGTVVTLTGLVDGERELWTAAVGTADTAYKDVWVVATPELIYDEKPSTTIADFYNGINDEGTKKVPMRVVKLVKGDIFGITADVITSTATPSSTNKYIKPAAGGKWAAGEATATVGDYAQLIDITTQNGVIIYNYEVLV